jgi:hypothetical protein
MIVDLVGINELLSSHKDAGMFRSGLLVFGLILSATIANGGCQSCSSCHDYDCPVANCNCGHCPQCCPTAGCTSCGCGSCSEGGCDEGGCEQSGPAMHGQPVEGELVAPSGTEQPTNAN